MSKRNEIFPSKYVKSGDLRGKPLVEEIEWAPTETLGNGSEAERKTVLHFRGGTKPLPLNMTNWDAVAAIAGDDTDGWPGHRVELYPTTTELKGKIVDCIRIRAPRQTQEKQARQPMLALPCLRPVAWASASNLRFRVSLSVLRPRLHTSFLPPIPTTPPTPSSTPTPEKRSCFPVANQPDASTIQI